ncbi:MAG TPA: hypothetical protein VL286_06920 [Rhizomicrobium sp.]|nr:hypothetical protein [Rhizomicrobium sp.]
MPKRLVDVFDRGGAKLFTYMIGLEEEACLDAEFEEVALIFAERSGLVAAEEIPHLTAACEGAASVPESVQVSKPARAKGNVLSLIKHRMKKASLSGSARSKRHA